MRVLRRSVRRHLKLDGKKKNNSPSIDRIVPALGYVRGNVALLCWRCNNLKRDATAAELQKVVDWMKSRSRLWEGNEAKSA